ncbi:hypothetical protein ACHAPJ_008956 [Fusarium lateritium]
MSSWKVNSITIKTVADGHEKNNLYANGRMQIPVIVLIKASEKDVNKRHHLSPKELESVKLIDYYNNEGLTGGWTYSTTENEFSHTRASFTIEQDDVADDEPDVVQFWVSTTKFETKEIAASVQSPEGENRTNKDPNHSSVIITGTVPIKYKKDDVEITPVEILQGNYLLEWEDVLQDWHEAWPKYWQTNYYISLKNHFPLIKRDVHGLKNAVTPRLANSFGYWRSDTNLNLRIYYIWDCNPEPIKEVGVKVDCLIHVGPLLNQRIAHAEKDIRVDQNPDTLCMTIMYYASDDRIWGESWYTELDLVIYDTYGNTDST